MQIARAIPDLFSYSHRACSPSHYCATASLTTIALAILDALSTLNSCSAVCIPVSYYVTNSIAHGFQDYAPSDATLLGATSSKTRFTLNSIAQRRFPYLLSSNHTYRARSDSADRIHVRRKFTQTLQFRTKERKSIHCADIPRQEDHRGFNIRKWRRLKSQMCVQAANFCQEPVSPSACFNPQDLVALLLHPFQGQNFAPYMPTSRCSSENASRSIMSFFRNFTCTFNDVRGAPMAPL
ncbi:hypothetical protein B0H19DRAFT_1169865 [Mycena capillaripes]|nr:hypothetical protein B0H19DRAFT_1169865 [Mycena capillaripes]